MDRLKKGMKCIMIETKSLAKIKDTGIDENGYEYVNIIGSRWKYYEKDIDIKGTIEIQKYLKEDENI